ncbi:MAG: hypothetical protein H6704_26705 [Myxococcales bacterium]|nr:hypothetical protein [Myxococcales bacterium]
MTRAALLAVACVGLAGCQDVRTSDADGGVAPGAGGVPGAGGQVGAGGDPGGRRAGRRRRARRGRNPWGRWRPGAGGTQARAASGPGRRPGMECAPGTLEITAAPRATGAPLRRGEPLRIDVDATRGAIARLGTRGPLAGTVTPRPDHLVWTYAGTPAQRAGAHTVTVVARDAAGCEATADVTVDLLGDLVAGDDRGRVLFIGSDGTYLDTLATLGEGDVEALVALPDGRFLAGTDEPAIYLLRADGSVATPFEMEFLDEPIYRDTGQSAYPHNLVWDEARERVWADGDRNAVHTWTLDGFYDATYELDFAAGYTTVGFAWADDYLAVGQFDQSRVRKVRPADGGGDDQAFTDLGSFGMFGGMTNGPDGKVVISHYRSGSYYLGSYTRAGGGTPVEVEGSPVHLTRMGPYIVALGHAGGSWLYDAADFTRLDDGGFLQRDLLSTLESRVTCLDWLR